MCLTIRGARISVRHVFYSKSEFYKSIILNEAKLIIIGEGEVGKTCLWTRYLAILGNNPSPPMV